jgi:ankyrin repeat protein
MRNGHEESGVAALHAAAENGDTDLVRELLARGASRQIRTAEGKTAADLAASDDLRRLLAPR